MESNFYVSSLAFQGKSVNEIIDICKDNDFNLEFSSGLPYRSDMRSIYLDAPIRKMIHNYFPAPEIPFVLNLASKDERIREQSINHCKRGLKLAKQNNSPFFAAHAGFCIDPDPNELGVKINFKNDFDRTSHKSIFLESVNEILQEANFLSIDFLIENNVIAQFNYEGNNPLLCCDFNEINWLINSVGDKRLGLLLDTAHLKVSCQTLNLDLPQEFQKIMPFVKALHHSDNDGLQDINSPIGVNYWFLKFKDFFKDHVQVLEVRNQDPIEIQEQLNLLYSNGN